MQDLAHRYGHRTIRGYAALIPTLIVCVVLTALGFQASTSTYLARVASDESAYAFESREHAHSCAQIALFELSADPGYRPHEAGDLVELAEGNACVIASVITEESLVIVTVTGSSRSFHTVLELVLEDRPGSRPPFSIRSFREI
ncbi:MAG: hypothetical protein V4644_00175 [Patescibacteria group bacterium]